MVDFWSLTNDEISRGMDLVHDRLLQDSNRFDPMIEFVYDKILQEMAIMLMECDWDRDLMRLKYADEIKELNDSDYSYVWFAPAGVKKGQLNVIVAGVGSGKSMVVDIESF